MSERASRGPSRGPSRRRTAASSGRSGRPPALLLTCEHAGHVVPREHARLFAGARDVLESHQGWDPGALRLAQLMARRLGPRLARPLLATRWSRLLVESNRSLTNPRLWSRFTKDLSREERQRIVDRYWRPHREEVEAAVEEVVARGGRVVHVAVHSFTPVLDGVARHADVALLFDSARRREAELARRWGALLGERAPDLRVRFNYPYRGSADGLATWLRRRHPETRYLGYELEVSQAVSTSAAWRGAGEALAASLAEAVGPSARASP